MGIQTLIMRMQSIGDSGNLWRLLSLRIFRYFYVMLAEYRSNKRNVCEAGAPIMVNGNRVWTIYKDLEFETEAFKLLGQDFEQTGKVIEGSVGSANTKLLSQKAAVDFALEWITRPIF